MLLIDKYDLDRFSAGGGQWTLLQQAVNQRSVACSTILLEYGADPNATYGDIPTPLQMAEEQMNRDFMALLETGGAK